MKRLLAFLAFVLTSFTVAATAFAATMQRDLEYGQAGGERLLLDASIPDGAGPFPIAILVHGGGWSRGDKSGLDEPGKGADITPWFAPLTAAHFTWFSLNYRLAPDHRWPAGLEDVQTAIRWVKAHAADFKGDASRIALFGHSSGGHVVCLAATLADEDTRVQAVIGFAAVTDLLADCERRGGLSTSLQKLLGRPQEFTPESRILLADLSPINHVRAGLPPFLLLHGDADKSVPYAQSIAFQARLHAAGVRCDLITIPGGPHGLLAWKQAAPDYPGRMIEWLSTALAVDAATPPAR